MTATFSRLDETARILQSILADSSLKIPQEVVAAASNVKFVNDSTEILLPCPFKELETQSALKAVEASTALVLSHLRYGTSLNSTQNGTGNGVSGKTAEIEETATIDTVMALLSLILTYLSSVDGMNKLDKLVVRKLKPTDLNQAQSITYRRMSANLYRTKDGRFYHIHGLLEASTTLNMIGLPAYAPEIVDYEKVVEVIQGAVSQFTCAELEALNEKNRQAGIEALKESDFLQTEQGKITQKAPLWEIDTLESETPPAAFSTSGNQQILKGIKVLELCRVIAGPTIGRTLAEYGATVLKVTSPHLPDVPFFQVDVNMGKHTADIDLKTESGKATFAALLKDADIVVDGYRAGCIEKLGFGPEKLAQLAKERGKGYIYASENCFGFKGPWMHRPGWQQISDCASGLAWAQGQALGLDEPMVPPFPMSDYGTGCVVSISVLLAVLKRAQYGGSYWCQSSLVQYDKFLLDQKPYPAFMWEKLLKQLPPEIFQLRYYDSVDRISSAALKFLKESHPELFDEEHGYFEKMHSDGFDGEILVLKPVIKYSRSRVGFLCASRPNGFDEPKWW